ncbi:MAG: guanylate kinase [Fibrobacter sp.]|jgi:guanylate kinase|nr:guanylate kinase [Fibrobacter sp.]
MEKNKGKIFVFSAPSGAGKTTILNKLKAAVPNLVYSISATTRKPRPGEIDGKHYFFMSVEEFKRKIDQKAFAEWAVVHENYYGTPRSFIDSTVEQGSHIIMDIDVFGKKQFDKLYPEAIGILIVPPSMEELERRLRGRKSNDDQDIRVRLKNATTEIEFASTQGKYEYTIINDDLSRAVDDVIKLVTSEINKTV